MYLNFVQRIVKRLAPPSKEELASLLLVDLIQGKPYLPYTNSSLFLHSMVCMINDLIINKRKRILEFGCGISTILLARAIRHNRLDVIIYSVEENADWIEVIRQYLKNEQLDGLVVFVHAPVEKSTFVDKAYSYNMSIVNNALSNQVFDLLIIDGPSAWKKEIINSRAANFELFKDRLSENFAIFIDNANRPGEQLLVKRIREGLQIKATRITDTFYVFTKGHHFNFIL